MQLHEQLRQAREKLGITQAELGARAGIPRNQVVRAEKGENITLDTLRKIAAHLPIESLTLLETVKLEVDAMPQREKVYSAASRTVSTLLTVLEAAVETAVTAQLDLGETRKTDPHTDPNPEGQALLLGGALEIINDLQKKLRAPRIEPAD